MCIEYNKKLIYPSSAAIYYPELSPYAGSKQLAELLIQNMIPKLNAIILRLFNVFGPNMNPDSGSIMYNFLTSDKIVIYGDGEQTRDYIHVRDVCEIIKYAILNDWNVTMDVGTGQAYSANYVAGLFAHFRKKEVEYAVPKREIKWSIADTTLLKMFYPLKLTTNLEKDVKLLCQN
jgi:UDP-glucose 4-epimerase